MDDLKMDFVLDIAYRFNGNVCSVQGNIVINDVAFSVKNYLTKQLDMTHIQYDGVVMSVEEFCN